jgi:ABC-type nitrate/sulfonate/bicarbonate transport system permease component
VPDPSGATSTLAPSPPPADDPATPVRLPRRKRPFGRRIVSGVSSLWLLVAIAILWQVVATLSPTLYFPPLSKIFVQFGNDWFAADPSSLFLSQHFFDAAVPSLRRLAQGWGLALVVGIPVGILLGRSAVAAAMYFPFIRFWLAEPKSAIIPVAVQIFGIADSMNVFLIFVGTVGLIIVNTADGVAGVDRMTLQTARSLRVSPLTLYRRVLVPAAMPGILTGVRVSIGVALILMVISELYATTAGVGYEILLNQQSFKFLQMWSAFLLIGVISVLLNVVLELIEKRVLRWQRREGLSGQ